MLRWFLSLLFVLGFAGSALAAGSAPYQHQLHQPLHDSFNTGKPFDLTKGNSQNHQDFLSFVFTIEHGGVISPVYTFLSLAGHELSQSSLRKAYLFVFSGQSPPRSRS